jgi:hypothetical protein
MYLWQKLGIHKKNKVHYSGQTTAGLKLKLSGDKVIDWVTSVTWTE